MNDTRTTPPPRTPWQELKGRLLRIARGLLILYAVAGVVGSVSSLFLATAPAFDSSPADSSPNFGDDVANSWNRFNADDATAAPSWTLDQVTAAAGEVRAGDIVTLRGSQSVIDEARVKKSLAGTRYVVVLTPPTPLGASETTRLRDNSAQQTWADQLGISLVLVHGQQVVVPFGKLNRTIIFSTPDAGLPQREAMRTGDVTDTLLSVLDSALKRTSDSSDSDDPGTLDAASVALTNTRAPTAAELAPVTRALDAGPLYVAPAVTAPVEYDPAWSSLAPGGRVKVVLLPFAKTGTAVDWTSALAARYPDTAILVMTGKWIESAGIDRDRVLAALWQTYAVGEFALASSPPAYVQILDWVTGVAGIARAAAAEHTGLPSAAPGGIPRWLSYLVLGTSLLIAAAFVVPPWWRRRSRGRPGRVTRGDWRDTLLTTMTTCSLQVGQAADLAFDDGVRARTRGALDEGDAALQALRAMPRDPLAPDDQQQQVAAARSAWFALDEAAKIVGRPDLRPGTLSPGLRPEPDEPPTTASQRVRRPARTRPRKPSRWLTWVMVVVFLGFIASTVFSTVIRSGGLGSTAESPTVLRNSNVSGLDGAQRTGVEQAIADRALMLVYDDRRDQSFDTADAVAAAYPNAVVFVIENGKIGSTGIGTEAAVRGYDEYSLIKDYYPVQFAAGTDPVAQARQLVLLYDRLTAEGSIRGAVRATFDGPDRPWTLIVIVVVLALIAAALIIRFGVGAASRRLTAGGDLRALRESLSLRLAGAQQEWLEHEAATGEVQAADWARRARDLQQRIATAEPADVDALTRQIDGLHAEISRR